MYDWIEFTVVTVCMVFVAFVVLAVELRRLLGRLAGFVARAAYGAPQIARAAAWKVQPLLEKFVRLARFVSQVMGGAWAYCTGDTPTLRVPSTIPQPMLSQENEIGLSSTSEDLVNDSNNKGSIPLETSLNIQEKQSKINCQVNVKICKSILFKKRVK